MDRIGVVTWKKNSPAPATVKPSQFPLGVPIEPRTDPAAARPRPRP